MKKQKGREMEWKGSSEERGRGFILMTTTRKGKDRIVCLMRKLEREREKGSI